MFSVQKWGIPKVKGTAMQFTTQISSSHSTPASFTGFKLSSQVKSQVATSSLLFTVLVNLKFLFLK